MSVISFRAEQTVEVVRAQVVEHEALDVRREGRHCGGGVDVADAEGGAEGFGEAADDADGLEGVAAEFEEVVVAADGVVGEDVGQMRESCSVGVWGGGVGCWLGVGWCRGRGGRRSILPLGVRGRWSRVMAGGGEHVAGELVGEVGA